MHLPCDPDSPDPAPVALHQDAIHGIHHTVVPYFRINLAETALRLDRLIFLRNLCQHIFIPVYQYQLHCRGS